MALEKIRSIKGRVQPCPGDDIDTDRVIPARFMKCVTFDGLGEYFFYDVRFDSDGKAKDTPLNDKRFEGASILLSGNNFGCGSSREHAPQSLHRYGIRAVIAEGFAEIFFGNSTTLGIPCVTVSKVVREELQTLVENKPELEVEIDLDAGVIRAGEKEFSFSMRDAAKDALASGNWDPLGILLEGEQDVANTVSQLAYMEKA